MAKLMPVHRFNQPVNRGPHFSRPQHNNGPESACFSLTPIGVEKVSPAAGADTGDFNIFLPEARIYKLPLTDGPQIEVVFADHEFFEAIWEYLFMADKFSAAGPERGSDGRQEIVSLATKIVFHSCNNVSEYILGIPPPTTMDVGHHSFFGVKYDDPLAVRLLHQDSNVRGVCYNGVYGRGFYLSVYLLWSKNKNTVTMRLVHEDEMVGAKGILNNCKI